MKKIGVLGAGTWGMALGRSLCLGGHKVTLWSALPREIDALRETGKHPNLPGMQVPEEMVFTKEIAEAVCGMELVLFAVPSPFVRSTARLAAPYFAAGQVVVDAAKGIESDTLFTMTEVLESELGGLGLHFVALSGPTHAEEVAKDLPTTIVSACREESVAKWVQEVFTTPMLRVYTNTDVLGVELCGAVKNVIALACGVATGLGYGDNTRAALITRGIAEITRLGTAMGAREQTFGGLAGIGDLIVTATSVHSRNNRCGILIGRGLSPEEAVKEVGMVVEGLNALPAVLRLRDRFGVEMPIVDAVERIVRGGVAPEEAVRMLMARDQKSELPPLVTAES